MRNVSRLKSIAVGAALFFAGSILALVVTANAGPVISVRPSQVELAPLETDTRLGDGHRAGRQWASPPFTEFQGGTTFTSRSGNILLVNPDLDDSVNVRLHCYGSNGASVPVVGNALKQIGPSAHGFLSLSLTTPTPGMGEPVRWCHVQASLPVVAFLEVKQIVPGERDRTISWAPMYILAR